MPISRLTYVPQRNYILEAEKLITKTIFTSIPSLLFTKHFLALMPVFEPSALFPLSFIPAPFTQDRVTTCTQPGSAKHHEMTLKAYTTMQNADEY
jgi:hypothetical protein